MQALAAAAVLGVDRADGEDVALDPPGLGPLHGADTEEVGQEHPDALPRLVDGDHPAVVHHHGPRAVLADHVGGVADDHDGPALALEPLDVVEALALERGVTDGEHLVDQEHVGLDVDRHREPEPRRTCPRSRT